MISDSVARQQALEPQRSFIVQAPAGSGKTGLLVYRYLTLLATVEKPQNVLAITFTRKARAEMRERVIELIQAAEKGHVSQDGFEQQGIDLAKQVLSRDTALGWDLLSAPHQMQILTIDAFSARLAASMPWLSRLGDRPNTTDSAEAHFAYAIDQVMDELLNEGSDINEALQVVMLELDFNYDKARRLFLAMLAKRDQWLRHLVANDLSQMRSDLQHAWAELVDDCLRDVRTLMSDGLLETILKFAVEAAQRIDYQNSRAAQKMVALTEFDGGLDELQHSHWLALCDFLLVKAGDKVRAAPDKNTGFEAGHPDKPACKELFDELRDDVELVSALGELMQLPSPSFNEQDWQCLMALEQVLKHLAIHLQLRFRAAGECDHSEVTQRANMALAELNNPTDLGLLMDGQIHHILVDEFQDTSNAQLNLLKQLTAGWQSQEAEAKTLFLVGDPMQSIYRFREADVGLFLQVANNAQTHVFDNIEIESLKLSHNFRSSAGLVSWFNQTFEQSFPKRDDVLTGAIRYSQASTLGDADAQGCVEYRLANDRPQEAETLLSLVESAIAELPDDKSKVAILVRSRPQLDYLLPLLDRNGIEYSAVDIQALHEQQAIQDAVALCRAICREDDRISWLALLRGPWCGLQLSQIHVLATDHQSSIWQSINDKTKLQKLDVESLQRLRRFADVMSQARKQHQQTDLGSLTHWAWLRLGGLETMGNCQLKDLEQLFDLLNSMQRGGDLPSQKELATALEKMRASTADDDATKVVVSTIHKSKGLQYDTVILPSLSSKANIDDHQILMWAERQTRDGDSSLLLAPLMFETRQGSHHSYLRRLDSQRAQNEVMRLMYVACTRAERKLILMGCAKLNKKGDLSSPSKGSLLASVWPALEDVFELMPAVEEIQVNEDVSLDQTLHRVPADFQKQFGKDFAWRAIEQLTAADSEGDEQEVTYDWATQVATAVGIILHDVLQFAQNRILTLTVDDDIKHRWRAELIALRVPDNRVEYALRRLQQAVHNIQQDQTAHFIFADYAIQQNEYALSTLEAGAVKKYRLDRTFVDNQDVRWIVDYKTTTTQASDVEGFVDQQVDERHRKQLNNYGELMSKIDARKIMLAVYFPLLKQIRTWEYQSA